VSPPPAPAHAGLDRLTALARACALAPACDRFFFLRHGQTGRNAARIFQGPDEPLSETGIAQAERAALRLAREPLAAIVASSMPRAVETARIVAAQHRLVPQLHEGLRERHFGALIGTSAAQIDWACSPEGGETLDRFVQRTHQGLCAALAERAPTLVVAHGGTLYVLAALLGVGAGAEVFGNAQPLCFERGPGGWQARALLPADGAAAHLA